MMKKKLLSILFTLFLTTTVLGTNAHAVYDNSNVDRTNVSNRVDNYDVNRVNNDVRMRNVNTTNDVAPTRTTGFNWAWLGLFGLLGLLGLRKGDRDDRETR